MNSRAKQYTVLIANTIERHKIVGVLSSATHNQ